MWLNCSLYSGRQTAESMCAFLPAIITTNTPWGICLTPSGLRGTQAGGGARSLRLITPVAGQ